MGVHALAPQVYRCVDEIQQQKTENLLRQVHDAS